MNKQALLLLDGNSLINRAFYGLFGRQQLTAPDGTPTGALFAFLNMFLRYLDQVSPSHVVVAFDRQEPTLRHDLYADYKGTRKPMPDELAQQIPVLKDILDALGICRIEKAGYEADDLLGTLAEMGKASQLPVYIVSGDKDSFQLIDDQVIVIWPVTRQGQSDLEIYDREAVSRRYQLTPEQFVDFKAIMGDPSDNIPGVKGIGEKGAMQLLQQYHSMDQIYQSLDQIRPTLAKKLSESRDLAYLSRQLAKICRDVPIEYELADFQRKVMPDDQLAALLNKLGLRQIINRLGLSDRQQEISEPALADDRLVRITLAEFLEKIAQLKPDERWALWIDEQKQLILTWDGETAVGLAADQLEPAWQALAASNARPALSDYKEILKKWSLPPLKEAAHDVLIASHLLQQTDGRPDLQRIYQAVTGQMLQLETEEAGEYSQPELFAASEDHSKSRAEADSSQDSPESALALNLQKLGAIYKIAVEQGKMIAERGINELVFGIEMPLAAILAGMETAGFAVDQQAIEKLGQMMDGQLTALQEDIYRLTGQTFNLNSPRQLSQVLFEELGLKSGKKRSGGAFSTDSDELERLRDEHPAVPLIIEYRQTAKLRSTYIEGLKKVINPLDNRVHTTFNQMLTTTGRLSSSEPNLQNIPIRMAAGQKIREAFVAAPGMVLLDADYSQIELRLLAHMADDPAMIKAFVEEEDIHTQTACHIFDCLPDQVTPEMRGIAKTMNFSIVYGISDFGLARDLGVPVKAAHRYIDEYDQQYPNVRVYLNRQVELAHEQGYVETLFGRRRYLHELKSSNRNIRQFGERAAMNAPVQGTAADLIKIAMVRVDRALREQGLKSRLILQVHDELILESPEAEIESASQILKEKMETAMQLKVPLQAEVHQGRSWAECK